MSEKQTNKKPLEFSWGHAFNLIKDYFINSDEKLVAWSLLGGIVLSIIGLVAMMALFAWCTSAFWVALTAKALGPLLLSVGQFALILGAYIGLSVCKNYCLGKLTILWRTWLTKKIINELFNGENNYLDLKRFSSQIDNIGQRIQEDVDVFVDNTLDMGADLLKSSLSLGTFITTLWMVGGSLTIPFFGLTIIIPGYLVWVALIVSLGSTAITHCIAQSLTERRQRGERAEADLRKELDLINNEAENIAEEHAEKYYKNTLKTKINNINNNENQTLYTESGLYAFQKFYSHVSEILPEIISAPLLFAGIISVPQVIQIGVAFREVHDALGWFIDSYEDITKFKTSALRIAELQHALTKEGLASNPKSILRTEKNKETIKIKELNILPPQASSTQIIMKILKLKFKPHEHTLIRGPSGLGKSTLFKVISGTWPYGEGKVTLPAGKNICFLPQRPTIPHDTLRAVLAYPDAVSIYTEEQYHSALKAVGGLDGLKLDEIRPWSRELSGGQQQRISFARALLKKPHWLFLDEATASLDEESERQVYTALQNLQDTTIISIAHGGSAKKYHSRVVLFSVNDKREVEINEIDGDLSVPNISS